MCIFVAMKGYSDYIDKDGYYDISLYCEWFEDHLHNYHVLEDGSKMYEGMSYEQFAIRHNNTTDYNSIKKYDEIIQLINDVDINNITPLDALYKLNELKNFVKNIKD